MKKYINIIPILVFIFSFVKPLKGAEFKIGTIDMKKVMKEYKDLQDAKKDMAAYETEWRRVQDSLYSLLQEKKSELKKKIPMLTPQGILDEQKKIDELEAEYHDYIKRIWGEGGEYSKKLKAITRPYLQKLYNTINQIAKDENFDLIIDKSAKSIIYTKNSLDITNEVLDYLNKEYVSNTNVETKKKIGVFPLLEKDKDVRTMGLGKRSQQYIIASLKNSPNFDVLPQGSINNKMSSMGIRPENLNEIEASQVANALNTDYFIIGEVTTQSQGIKFVLKLYESRTMRIINTIEGTAQNAEDAFEQALANKSRKLIAPIVPKK